MFQVLEFVTKYFLCLNSARDREIVLVIQNIVDGQ